MKKRLRKKKHVGEFREFGFAVNGTMHANLSNADHDAFFERWIALVDTRELLFGGGSSQNGFGGFVALGHPGSATDDDRRAVEAHFAADAAVASFTVGPLADAWR